MIPLKHKFYIQRALQLAEQGLFTARPNPAVGCVIVKNGMIVGEGYHAYTGGPHAEIVALRQAGEAAQDATAYVTLEPCAHTGRTGPCSDALIKAGIRQVVACMTDPFKLVSGQGFARLEAAGIQVIRDADVAGATDIMAGFISRQMRHRPYVRAKVGMSLDGKIALHNNQSQWITSPASRAKVQYWRARSGAVLTSGATVLADNPSLLVRDESYVTRAHFQQPKRVIIDSQAHTRQHPDLQVWSDGAQTMLLTTQQQDHAICLPDFEGHVCLKSAMAYLAECEINDVLVEAGGGLLGALIEAKLVDELICFIAPKLLGDTAKSIAALQPRDHLKDTIPLQFKSHESIGPDIMCRAVLPWAAQ